MKYAIERVGLKVFRAEVERRAGVRLASARPVCFTDQGDRYDWVSGADGHWHLTLYVEGSSACPREGAPAGLWSIRGSGMSSPPALAHNRPCCCTC